MATMIPTMTGGPTGKPLKLAGSPPELDAAVEVHPDVALVERAKAGDQAAFEVLIKQY